MIDQTCLPDCKQAGTRFINYLKVFAFLPVGRQVLVWAMRLDIVCRIKCQKHFVIQNNRAHRQRQFYITANYSYKYVTKEIIQWMIAFGGEMMRLGNIVATNKLNVSQIGFYIITHRFIFDK